MRLRRLFLRTSCAAIVASPANLFQALKHKANMPSPAPSPSPPVFRTALRGLERIHEGKVRDIYAIDAETLLIVTTDRLSAFDVVLPDPIPEKGRVLTEISNFWFNRTRHIVPNQLTERSVDSVVKDPDERALLRGRTMLVRRLRALPIEAVVRGYLIGSGWKDYQKTGALCGITLQIKTPPPQSSPGDRGRK